MNHQWVQKDPEGKPQKKTIKELGPGAHACYCCGAVQQSLRIGSGYRDWRTQYLVLDPTTEQYKIVKKLPACQRPVRKTAYQHLMAED